MDEPTAPCRLCNERIPLDVTECPNCAHRGPRRPDTYIMAGLILGLTVVFAPLGVVVMAYGMYLMCRDDYGPIRPEDRPETNT